MSAQPFPTRAELLRQYEINVDLYKHYLKLTIELNVFYYAITGALVSYYFVHKDDSLVQWSLVLPLVMSILFAALFIYGAIQQRLLRQEVFRIRDALSFQVVPDLLVLSVLLYIFSALMLVVAVALGVLIVCGPHAT